MIDSHTHLDSCAPPDEELVAAAVAAGVRRILTVGMDGPSGRSALRAAERFGEVHAAIGRHPNLAEGFDDVALAELRELAGHPRCAAIGETGLDYFRDRAPRGDQRRAFHAQIELARETAKPLVIHTRAAENDTIATLRERAGGVQVVLHCFSMPSRLQECLAEGWWISFAGNVTYPRSQELAAQSADAELAAAFAPLAERLAADEEAITAELLAVQGQMVDLGGYYAPDAVRATEVMRPSQTFNTALATLGA